MKFQSKSTVCCALSFLLLMACSSDDGGDGGQQGIEFAGTWTLTQINLSAAIDADGDGATSANLLEEAECLRETITLGETFEWTSSGINAQLITQITGNLYNVSCSDLENEDGDWGVSRSNLFLIGSVNRTFLISGNQLIENLGRDLPGIRTMVYERQP